MICPMCCRDVQAFHQRSHVLPDWMFKESYSADHKLIHVDMNELTAAKKQSATHGSFWCDACEKQSGSDDRYANLILTNSSPTSPEHKQISRRSLKTGDDKNPGVELWTGIEFKRFQNFIFSCVLRGQFFLRLQNKNILGEKHFVAIRSMYLDQNLIDDESYPILVSRSPDDDEQRNWGFLPHRTRLFNHNGVMFRGGGFQVQVYVSGHPKPDAVVLGRLNKHGEVPVIVDHYKNTGSFKASQNRLTTITKTHPLEKVIGGKKRK